MTHVSPQATQWIQVLFRLWVWGKSVWSRKGHFGEKMNLFCPVSWHLFNAWRGLDARVDAPWWNELEGAVQ